MSACISFAVHNVEANTEPLSDTPVTDVASAVSDELGELVACYTPDTDVPVVATFASPNLLVSSVYNAFYDHYPLKLNPNVVWLTIAQGFAQYVNRHAEALRSKFVNHDKKKKILIVRRDFRYKSANNNWPSVFPQFAAELEKRTHGGVRELIECNFSNTTPTDRVSSHIALMDVCQQYFNYRMKCGCGFPRIDLMGTVEDWRTVRAKAEGLKQYALAEVQHFSVWLEALLPALDHFVEAAEGRPNLAFWGSVCNMRIGSGAPGDPVTGWINVFFPYVGGVGLVENGQCDVWAAAFQKAQELGVEEVLRAADNANWQDKDPHWIYGAIQLDHFPTGLSSAPVHIRWDDVGIDQDVLFYGGMFAMHQHPDGALEVRTGWAVAEVKPEKEK
jgi:hypothetical protein